MAKPTGPTNAGTAEPTAAALAYRLHKKTYETVLVLDLGARTFDVTVLDVGDGAVDVRGTARDPHLGGDDFDRRLADHLAEGFQRAEGIDPREDPRTSQRLFEAAEKAKTELSSVTRTQVSLAFADADTASPKHLTETLHRPTFEQLTADLLERCREPVKQAMSDAGVSAEDLDKVILVGGSTRMPAVHSLVKRMTGGRDRRTSVNPDEEATLGAAARAGVLTGEVTDVLLLDVTPLSLGEETAGGVMTRFIERNTPLPVRRSEIFSTAEDDQPAVDVVVLQGERELAAGNRVLGRFRLENLRPARRGRTRIEVTFDVDADGILTVGARYAEDARDAGHAGHAGHAENTLAGGEQSITVNENANLDPYDVERMIAEADQCRGSDLAEREAIDARNELDAADHQVERRLAGLGDRAPEQEKARAERLVGEARAAVEEEAPADRARTLTSELQRVHAGLADRAAERPASESSAASGSTTADDDVIDPVFHGS